MSDDAEIERALAEVIARQTALETELQRRRAREALETHRLRARADALHARISAMEREHEALEVLALQMEQTRRVVLGFSRRGWRVAQHLIRAALVASSMLALLMLGGLEPVSGWLTFALTFGGGFIAWRLGDAADHLELQ